MPLSAGLVILADSFSRKLSFFRVIPWPRVLDLLSRLNQAIWFRTRTGQELAFDRITTRAEFPCEALRLGRSCSNFSWLHIDRELLAALPDPVLVPPGRDVESIDPPLPASPIGALQPAERLL